MSFGYPYETPYKFNGKEKDEETGYNYYEARYYGSDLSIFLSVDEFSDKYPHLSPYCYVANNPIKYIDPDGRVIKFAKGTSAEFQKGFMAAAVHLAKHGRADNLLKVIRSSQVLTVTELAPGDRKGARFNPVTNTLYWSPTVGSTTTEGVDLSPATVLDHEMDHIQQKFNKLIEFIMDIITKIPNYDYQEEKRVIEGTEQKTAKALGEIEDGEVTRKDHRGEIIETKGPTTNERKDPIIIVAPKEKPKKDE